MSGSFRTRRPLVMETSPDSHSRLLVVERFVNDGANHHAWCVLVIISTSTVTIDSVFVPLDPGARSSRNDCLTIADLDGVLENRRRPVDVLEPVTRWRRGEQVCAELGIEMR